MQQELDLLYVFIRRVSANISEHRKKKFYELVEDLEDLLLAELATNILNDTETLDSADYKTIKINVESVTMNFDEYQQKSLETVVFDEDVALPYLALGLVSESGEVAGKVKKVLRGDYPLDSISEDLKKEIGDVLWYIAVLSDFLGYKLSEIAISNYEKLHKRKLENKIKGDGDNR